MPTFNDPEALKKHLSEALGAQLRLTVVQAQADLGSAAVSPVDTGRFRSSWFASKSRPSSEVAPEGASTPQSDAEALRLVAGDEVHLTNSLPYAEAVAVEGRVVSKPATWFRSFREARLPRIQDAAGKLIKKQYDL
ncbi:putative tail protein [Cyanophage S-2L]|nr:putative tail protein [Cyanophage S-2L]